MISDLLRSFENENGWLPTARIANNRIITEKLLNFELDTALIEGPVTEHELITEPWMEDEMVVVAPKEHPLTGRPVTYEELSTARWVLRETGSASREFFDTQLRQKLSDVTVKIELNSFDAILRSVLVGLGLTYISSRALSDPFYGRFLSRVEIPDRFMRQLSFCREIADLNAARGERPLAFVDTYGCQQNEADSERIRGYLARMGYGFTQDEEEARVIVINTCAIREHAEQRVFGNLGALVHAKRNHPGQIICVCGCMAQEKHVSERIKQSFRHVDLVFGPHALWRFPELLWRIHTRRGRIFDTPDEAGSIAEGIPVRREGKVKAWVSIMYGCNNFCSYCIVPYVRGRERSRQPEDILAEVRQLAAATRS